MTTKAAIYCRVSTDEQNPDLQLSELERMAEARGFEIVERYIDRGISGAKGRRPELDRLMTDARRGKFRAVLVWKLDRFARSLRHLVNALEELEGYGVDFVSHQDPVDTSTPSGRLLFQIIGAMAEFERSLIRERVTAGLRQAKKRGVKLGRRATEIDVARALELRKEGATLRDIASELEVSKDKVHRVLQAMA